MTDYDYRADEYIQLCHAMQSGVAFTMGPSVEDPKHLRVGINVSMVEHGALVQTLVEAGVIDYEKYVDNKIELMKKEAATYAAILRDKTGKDINLL